MSKDMSSSVSQRLKQYQTDFIERGATFTETWTLYPNSKPTNVMIHFQGFRLPDGRMALQCEAFGAVDEQPDNIRSAEALLHTDVMITLFSFDGPPLYMNPAARRAAHDVGAALSHMFVDELDFDALMFDLEGAGEHRRVARVRTSNGLRWLDISAKQCNDAITGEPTILVTAIDVSDLKNAEDKARYLANRDQLTGCFNRSYLQHHSERFTSLGGARRALLYFDVDRFKQINDTFGHEMGDAVLIDLAARAHDLAQQQDLVVRLGGDEFVMVIQDADGDSALLRRVETVFQALSQPVQRGQTCIDCKISMGVAMFQSGDLDVNEALKRADIALYKAKNSGRHRYTFYDAAMGEAAERRYRTEAEIDRGLKRHEFILHYQPRIDVKTGETASVEGLVRWMHPDRGLVQPGEFISICEETGMIEELGRQVLDMGFAQAQTWRQDGLPTGMSLNLSPRQFEDTGLFDILQSCSNADGFVPGRIELEITESVLIGEPDLIAAKLHAITDMGFEIAIDDFGTGYSNLSYISRFPLHTLKIDRSFIAQLPKSGPIIRLILALAQQIQAKTVAEGVETQEQFDWLADHGCDQIQGFYIAKPAPVDEIPALMEQIRHRF
ncbi:EAL domain-containing protein [Gymnodinialimonas sp. 2305UL16-5]|uniref:putative bifunctional diguanylate cyclase/phosphodiesterase n=1 Tax=Gymnodinialimonas mytili TaxID=3126503 RepID=UPI0030B4CCF6